MISEGLSLFASDYPPTSPYILTWLDFSQAFSITANHCCEKNYSTQVYERMPAANAA